MAEAEIRSTMRSFLGGPPVKVLLLGEETVGKTSMARLISNYAHAIESSSEDPSWKRALMSLHQASLQVTKTSGRVQRTEVSLDGGALVQFVDMPGAECREGLNNEGEESKTHERHLKDAIRHTDYLNCAILVVNGSKAKMPASVAHELRVIKDLMPSSFLDKIVVLATHCDAPQKRALPTSELREAFGREPLVIHIENPFGRLSGFKEDELKQAISGHEPENDSDETLSAEIRSEVRKSVRAISELLGTLKPFPPTTVPVQSEGSFGMVNLKRPVGRRRDTVTSFTEDPGYIPSLSVYSQLFMPPDFTNVMIRQPLGGQPDWQKMFKAWNVINVTVMLVCSVFYYILETLEDIANFSVLVFAGHFFERLLHLLAFILFSHLTWYMAMRKSLINLLVPLGPHYYWIVAVIFLYFWLECVWVAHHANDEMYEIFFLPLIVPTFYICHTCFRLFQVEKQAQHARDLQPVEPEDVELSPNPAAHPLST